MKSCYDPNVNCDFWSAADVFAVVVRTRATTHSITTMGIDDHAAMSAHLYDAVGEIWLQLFGEHVHVGVSCRRSCWLCSVPAECAPLYQHLDASNTRNVHFENKQTVEPA